MPRKDGKKKRKRSRATRVMEWLPLGYACPYERVALIYYWSSVYYINGQWLTSPPIETNTWDVYICTCMYICDEVLTGSTYKGSHMVLRVRFILKKYKIYIFTDRWEHRYGYVYGTQIFSVVHAYCVWIFSITKSILIRTIYRIDTFFLEISWNLTSRDSRFESETLRNLETFEIRNFQNPSIIFSLFSFFF